MKNKIINFILYCFSFYFVIYIGFAIFTNAYFMSDLFNKIHIETPPFIHIILAFIGFGCFVSGIQYEIEKRKEAKK